MEIPLDIVDYIFSFLILDEKSLVACSEAHPVFSRMVEKYQYYLVNIYGFEFGAKRNPLYVAKLFSDKPRIATCVRVLQVPIYRHTYRWALYLKQMTVILPMFPLLECLVLANSIDKVSWKKDLSPSFRKAVEDCLRLPTLQEIHIGCLDFPLSTLDGHANITYFSFTGTLQLSTFGDTTYPQLRSLSVRIENGDDRSILGAWAIRHVAKLQSLKCTNETILELLESCSNTLNNLDLSLIDFDQFAKFATVYSVKQSHLPLRNHIPIPINLASLPHLQHLTIRAWIHFDADNETCISFLPAAMEILKTASSLRQVTIELNVDSASDDDPDRNSQLANCDVDFSPLTALAQFPGSFHRIDFYFNSEEDCTDRDIVSLLENHAGLKELIERGVLVVHPDTAPVFLDMVSKRTIYI